MAAVPQKNAEFKPKTTTYNQSKVLTKEKTNKKAAMAKLVYAPGLGLGGLSMGVRVPLAVSFLFFYYLVGLWWGYGGAMGGLWGGYGGAIAPHLRALSPPTLFIRPPLAGAIAPQFVFVAPHVVRSPPTA
jgi:hypothetical protein